MTLLLAFTTDALEPMGTVPLPHLLTLQQTGVVVGVVGEWEQVQVACPGLNFYTRPIPTLTDKLQSLAHSLTPRPVVKLCVGVNEEEKGQTLDAGWHFCHHSSYETWKKTHSSTPDLLVRQAEVWLDAFNRIKAVVKDEELARLLLVEVIRGSKK